MGMLLGMEHGAVHSLAANADAPGMGVSDVRRDATVRAIESALPSVVNISTEEVVEVHDPLSELFSDFFGPFNRRRPTGTQKSLGSGVIIDDSGYLLTNLHVVRRATRITVTLADGREFEAKWIVGTTKSDVALLQLITDGKQQFRGIKFAADDDLILGETVLALGNPFGLGGSVSRGILSSKTRRPAADNEPLGVENWLQTDAAINPGNSGGPLINLRGELIGLNVAVYRAAQGIGFAIPIKAVSETLSEIFTPEAMKEFWFGGRLKNGPNGPVVSFVEPRSPAAEGGLKIGDLVRRVNGKAPRNLIEANRELVNMKDGAAAKFVVERNGKEEELSIKLVAEQSVFNTALIRRKIGLDVHELTPFLATRMGLNGATGLLISGVEKRGPADEVGLKRDFVIQAIENQPVETIGQASKLLYFKKPGEQVKMNVIVQRQQGNFLVPYSGTATVTVR